MARYFFHLRDGEDILLDPEGIELADIEAVQKKALESARDTLSHDMKDGVLDLKYRIDVEDAGGTVVYSLPLRDAFRMVDH